MADPPTSQPLAASTPTDPLHAIQQQLALIRTNALADLAAVRDQLAAARNERKALDARIRSLVATEEALVATTRRLDPTPRRARHTRSPQ